MFFLFLFFLAIVLILEGTITTLPLVFVCLLCLTVTTRDWRIFPVAFIAGLVLDTFVFRPLGATSIFFLVCFFLILLYQRKYEINTIPFVVVSSFAGTFIFLLVFGYKFAFVQAIIATLISVGLFNFIQIILHRGERQ